MKMLYQSPACQVLPYESTNEELQHQPVSRMLSEHRAEHGQSTRGEVTAQNRTVRNGHASMVISLTGPRSEDITAIAHELERTLFNRGKQVYYLAVGRAMERLRDQFLPRPEDTKAELAELTRRHAQMVHILADAGMVVITGSLSPYQSDREMARRILEPHPFVEIFVNSSSSQPQQEEVAREQIITRVDFSGPRSAQAEDGRYENPAEPLVELDTRRDGITESVSKILWHLAKHQ